MTTLNLCVKSYPQLNFTSNKNQTIPLTYQSNLAIPIMRILFGDTEI